MPILAAELQEKCRRSRPAGLLVLLALVVALLVGVGTAPLWLGPQWLPLSGGWKVTAGDGRDTGLPSGVHVDSGYGYRLWHVRCGDWMWLVLWDG